MNQVNQVVKLHMRNKMASWAIPWIIIGANFLINFLIAMSLDKGESINTGAIVSIFIYTLVAGTVTIKETFPFALGLSIRRKDYFFGTAVTAIIVNVSSALGLVILSVIEEATNGWGVRLHLFKIQFLNDLSLIGTLGIYLIVLLHMYFLGFAISSLHRRFGGASMYIFFTSLLLIGTVVSYTFTHFGLWGGLLDWFIHSYMDIFWWMVPLVVVYLVAAYGLLRRATA
ncbi:hypothetical protein [Paenibacillus alginolyticus]|uniref:ABC transporter permease n=1 Tax=Paenibacillus alginolyticus TaxID=59839 RepID=A0ABT4G7D8_9BACL|nr:hypothetical protein [Paenibacillus alginolyticus]MCY9692077.1 hypothetical protein [Paenibacillus alginolyticus]MEC0147842.1 hypothetical protein [Paenibacillus alginolyticus]